MTAISASAASGAAGGAGAGAGGADWRTSKSPAVALRLAPFFATNKSIADAISATTVYSCPFLKTDAASAVSRKRLS